MTYKFTNRANKAIEIANDIALELGHSYIGTEHILYGLAKEENGVASKVLHNQDITSEEIAKKIVLDYANEHIDKTDNVQIALDNVFVVWFCKTLQNWKALVSTNLPDGMYYEVTYNGDKKEVYLDAYKKFENRKITELPH